MTLAVLHYAWRQIVLCRLCTAQILERHGTAHACAVYRHCYQLHGDSWLQLLHPELAWYSWPSEH